MMNKQEWLRYKYRAQLYIVAALNYFRWLPAIEEMMSRED